MLLIGRVTNKVLAQAKTPYWSVSECADLATECSLATDTRIARSRDQRNLARM